MHSDYIHDRPHKSALLRCFTPILCEGQKIGQKGYFQNSYIPLSSAVDIKALDVHGSANKLKLKLIVKIILNLDYV